MLNLLGILKSITSGSLINESAYKLSYSYKNMPIYDHIL